MTTKTIAAVGSVALLGVLWGTVGLERVPGDHERGTAWVPFVKHLITFSVVFENPALAGLELEPYEGLSAVLRASVVEFCDVRHGTTDVPKCYGLTIKPGD